MTFNKWMVKQMVVFLVPRDIIAQQQKRINYWNPQELEWTTRKLCWLKKAILKMLQNV